jgi:choline dehydrogenase-like flavoprotein
MNSADYVIVGAGSAGCVLAGRLSEDPDVTVTVIEAGGKGRHPNIAIPAAFAKQFNTKLDWDFATEPEPHCAQRSLYVPRGKGLGGSSNMNAMLYVRGRPLDYDQWERDYGATGWGWAGVLPYFLKAEDNQRGQSEFHGAGGPVRIEDSRSPRKLTGRFMATVESAGVPRIDDYNGPEQDGVAPVQVFQKNGRRWSAADAYLRPVMKRPNLTVLTGKQVVGLDLQGQRVTGVKLAGGDVVRAEREVILSAGAIGSPQLLLLSGIGPAAHLSQVAVPVVHDLPGVGANLQDHPYCTLVWESSAAESLYGADKPKYLLEWIFRRSGPLSSSVAEAFAFVRSTAGLPAPDIQFHFAPAYFVDHGNEEFEGHAFTIGPALVTPRSRGSVRLRSADPTAKPRILTNTLSDSEDVGAFVRSIRQAREWVKLGPLGAATAREIYPGPDVESDDDLEAWVRAHVELLYHPSGTCRMGSGDDSVVDPELRVRGLEGIRVCDASIFPMIPGGNTNAPAMMVAEKGADIIRGSSQG